MFTFDNKQRSNISAKRNDTEWQMMTLLNVWQNAKHKWRFFKS